MQFCHALRVVKCRELGFFPLRVYLPVYKFVYDRGLGAAKYVGEPLLSGVFVTCSTTTLTSIARPNTQFSGFSHREFSCVVQSLLKSTTMRLCLGKQVRFTLWKPDLPSNLAVFELLHRLVEFREPYHSGLKFEEASFCKFQSFVNVSKTTDQRAFD